MESDSDKSPAGPVIVARVVCEVGEGPIWHPEEQKLYWVDIPRGRLYRYDPCSSSHEMVYEHDRIGGLTIQEDGALLLAMPGGAFRSWKDGCVSTLIDGIGGMEGRLFNDAIADCRGRVFSGVPADEKSPGQLYRIDPDTSAHIVDDGFDQPNGLGFSPDKSLLYFTDSGHGNIYVYDFDPDSGDIRNRRVFVHVPPERGVPDGMTVDSDGFVWSAHWGGAMIVRYAPDGREVSNVRLPVSQTSSIAFGGKDLTDAYVSSAARSRPEEEGAGAGSLFHFVTDVRGLPESRSRICL